jgi:hypothetical protein
MKMNETIEYQWSEQLSKSAMDAYYKTTLGRPWLMFLGGIVFCFVGLFIGHRKQDYTTPTILIVFGVIFLARTIKLHFDKITVSKDAGKLLPDRTVTVSLTDDSITVSASGYNRTLHWASFTRLKEVDSFLFLFCGKVFAASLPSESFSQEQIEFIKSKIRKK